MVRVSIEEKTFSFDRLAPIATVIREIGADSFVAAVGTLVCLWHRSQAKGATHATASDIARWTLVKKEAAQQLIDAMIAAGFLDIDGEAYRIRGNADQIAAIQKHSEKSKRRQVCQSRPVDGTQLVPSMIFDLWNSTRSKDFPKARAMTPGREIKIRARIKMFPRIDDWNAAIERLNKWDFAAGQNDSGWRADLDYLLSGKGIKFFEGDVAQKPTKNHRPWEVSTYKHDEPFAFNEWKDPNEEKQHG